MEQKAKLRKLHSSRTKAVNEYIEKLHDNVNELYEALMDSEVDEISKSQQRLHNNIKTIKMI